MPATAPSATAPSEAAPGRATVLAVGREGPQGAGGREGVAGEWRVGSAHGQSPPAVRGSGTVLVEAYRSRAHFKHLQWMLWTAKTSSGHE